MDVVTALCDQVLVLSYGEKIAEGEPAETIADPRVVSAYLGQRAAATARGGGVMNMPLLQRPVVTSWPVTPDGQPATLVAALARNAAEAGARIAFRERDRGVWQERSWADIFAEVMALAAAFEELGLGPGQALTVIGDNRVRLYTSVLAAMALRAFPSPVFPDVPPDELTAYTRHGNPHIAVAEDQEQVDKLLELRERTGRPVTILYDDPRGLSAYRAPGLLSLDAAIARGRELIDVEPVACGGSRGARAGGRYRRAAAFIGNDRGAEGRAASPPQSCRRRKQRRGRRLFPEARRPLRLFADGVGRGPCIHCRRGTCFCNSSSIFPNGRKPCCATCAKLRRRCISRPRGHGTTCSRAFRSAWPIPRRSSAGCSTISCRERSSGSVRDWRAGRRASPTGSPACFGEIFVFGPLKDFLGMTRTHRAYTGGEAMGEDTFLFFRALGIDLRQFYGQTETAALTAAQPEGQVMLHTVGKPMPGVEVRIDDSGEIQVRSGSVIDGYFDDPEASRKAHRRRLAAHRRCRLFRANGQLVVLGRVSEVVRTRAGERFIPNYIENRIKFSPYVRNVAVLGAGRDDLTAIVCIDLEAAGHWAEERGISFTSYADLSQKPEVAGLVASILRARQRTPAAAVARPPLREPAQGFRCRRRRDHADAQASAQLSSRSVIRP